MGKIMSNGSSERLALKKVKRLLLSTASSAVLIAGALGATAAVAAENISVEAQGLGAALKDFARQKKVHIMFGPELVQGKKTDGVVGDYTTEEFLSRLLSGHGLSYDIDEKGNIYISELSADNMVAGSASQADVSPDGEETSFVLEEIIVTATRREASMQDVPISMNAFSGAKIERSGVHDISDLQFLAAGLDVGQENGLTRVALRGIGSNSFSVGAESGVALHKDGVYIVQRPEIGMGFFDLERIEVLRGPQGMLYGRNATGGAVNMISKAPTDSFEAGGSVSYGNYSLVETQGYASGPLVEDVLLMRVAFKTRDHDGYTPNVFNGDRLDDGNFAGLRGTLRYMPVDNFNLDIKLDYGRDDGRPVYITSRARAGLPLAMEDEGFELPTSRRVNQDTSNLNEKETWGLSAKVDWDIGNTTVSALTAYREFTWLETLDSDGTALTLGIIDQEERITSQFSQELTLASSGDSGLEWVLGGYYFHGDESQYGDFVAPRSGFVATFITDDYTTDALAIFGEASYPVLEKLTLTLGARYSHEKKAISGRSIFVVPAIDFESLAQESHEDSWGSFTPKVALTYEVSDEVTAYATVGKGFKAGGYNGGSASNPQGAYAPETVVNYEIGLKSTTLDGRLKANLAAFFMDYADLQVQVVRINPVTQVSESVVQNAATAEIKGVEFEFQAQVSDSFSLDGNASYLNASFKNWPDAQDSSRGNASFDVSGNRMPNAPKWALFLGASYIAPIGDWGSVTLRGEYAYKGEVFFTAFEEDFLSQGSVSQLNARITFEDAEEKWTISAWGKNLTDETILGFSRETLSGATGHRRTSSYLPPRTYGVTVGYRF